MRTNSNEFLQVYPCICAWNHHHTLRNFSAVYRFTFTHYSLRENPFWRIYKIIQHTCNGDYKSIEEKFAELYKNY